jgi:hypothetical protein
MRGVHRRTLDAPGRGLLRVVFGGTPIAASGEPMEWFTESSIAVGLASVAVIGGLIAFGVRYLELRSRREEEAARLQMALTEPLAREPALRGSSILPVVSVPLRGGARVELTGWAPSRETRDAAVRAVMRTGLRLGQPVRVIDRVEVVDTIRRPA